MPERKHFGIDMRHLALVGLACLAIAAFGAAYDQPLAWTLCLPCVLSVFWGIRHAPRWLRIGTQGVAYSLLLLAIGLGFLFMAYPILSQQTATRLSLTAGYGLGIFAGLFLLGRGPWPLASSFLPTTVGLLVVDCFNPEAQIRPLLAGAGIMVFAYLALPAVGHKNRKEVRSLWFRLSIFAAIASLAAAGFIVVTPQIQSETEKLRFQFAQSQMSTYSGLSNTTRLGDLQELKLSARVVMRVWTDHPQNLRARAYTRFNGREWTVNPAIPMPLEIVPETTTSAALRNWQDSIPGNTFALSGTNFSEISSPYVQTRIIQKLFNNGMLVSPGNKLLVRADLPHLRVDFAENLQPPLGAGVESYGIVNRRDGDIAQRGPASASSEELAEALQLPGDTDPRLRILALRLAAGTASPEEKLRRTVGYLQREYHYSLRVGSFHSSQPIAEFLFEKKQGYCQYFAGAAAVLLRLEDVPTRYVSGFHVTENDRSGDHYVVREMDAHAWIESYIPGQGWVEADPTPSAEYDSLHAGLSRGWMAGMAEWAQAKFAEILVHLNSGDWQAELRWAWEQIKGVLRWCLSTTGGASLGAALLLAWLFRRLLRRKKRIARKASQATPFEFIEPAPELAQMLRRVDACWTRRGIPRPAHRTPLEHLDAIPAEKISAQLRSESRSVIEAYYRASFGGALISPADIRALQATCDSLDKDAKEK